MTVTSAAGMFLQSAAAHVFGDTAARQRGHAGHRDACIAVAVRDDLRPVDQPFVDELVTGLLPTLTEATCRVVRLYGNTDDLLWTLADYIRKWRLAGMVLVSVHAGDPLPELLRAAGFPAVSIGRTEADGIPFVDADNVGGARVAMAHLAERGRRRIALLNGEVSQLAMYDRLTGYRDGLDVAGLTYDPKLVVECDGTRAGGAAAMTRLLDRSPQLDAVLVTSAVMAAGALEVLQARGVELPGRLPLVTFDDGPMAAEYDLTAVSQPTAELGAAAADLVLDVVAGRRDVRQATILPTELIVRGSTTRSP